MFSGIVEEVGTITRNGIGDDGRLAVACAGVLDGVRVGDSIAVNGCCITVVEHSDTGFEADVMAETARRTTLAGLTAGTSVDLEAALRLGERIGGHLLSGHVDAVGEVIARVEEPAATVITVRAPVDVMACTVPQGSVAIDGISLTVVSTGTDTFTVSLIPHTLAVTVAGHWRPGDAVNLEADMLAKHVHHSVSLLHQTSGQAGPHGTH